MSVIVSLVFPYTPTIAQLCYHTNFIRDSDAMNRHRTSSPYLLLTAGFRILVLNRHIPRYNVIGYKAVLHRRFMANV